jgi:hypothetical protein
MSRKVSILASVLSASLAWSGSAGAAFFSDIWATSADGSMELYTGSLGVMGYAIAGAGNFRLTKNYQHMAFMAFNGWSDGPDGVAPGQPRRRNGFLVNDSGDGHLLSDWLVGKKAFRAVLYLRDASLQTYDPLAPPGTYINDPVTILGFRVANAGPFVDRGFNNTQFTGASADYTSPLLEGGENAASAWRMGPPNVSYGGTMGYSQPGDINAADPRAEYYRVSSRDSQHAGMEVNSAQEWFDADHSGYGGYSGSAQRFAFGWLVANSDAMMINSSTLNASDYVGGEDVRDYSDSGGFGDGWYATPIDRCIINALGADPEMKGLVFQSLAVPTYLNTLFYSRDQSGGIYGPYLAITATWAGDVDNDGRVNVIDILVMADSWALVKGDPNFDPEADLNCDGKVDLFDLLLVASDFGKSLDPVPAVLYSADMNTDPGWALDAGWAYGTPAGSSDPPQANTGANRIGYNLTITDYGNYENNLTGTRYATTGAINCTGYLDVQLKFYRWLRTDYPDYANIQVSTNGTTWTPVWDSATSIQDSSWQLMQYDISAVASNQPTVYLRWGMGPTDSSGTAGGWNIDDVMVTGDPLP